MKFKIIILLLFAIAVLPIAYPYIFPDPSERENADKTPDLSTSAEPIETTDLPDPALDQPPVQEIPAEEVPVVVAEAEPEPEVVFQEPEEDPYIPPEVRDPGQGLLVFGQLPEEFLPVVEQPILVAEPEPDPVVEQPILVAEVEPEPEPEVVFEEPEEDSYIPPEVRDPGQGLLVFGQLPEEFLPVVEQPILVAEPEPEPVVEQPILVAEAEPEPEVVFEEPEEDPYIPPEVRDPGEGLLVFGQLPNEFLPVVEQPILVAEADPEPEPEPEPEVIFEEPAEEPIAEEPSQVAEANPQGAAETPSTGPEFAPLRVLYPNQQPQVLQNTLKIFAMPVVVSQLEGNYKNRFHPFDIGKKTGRIVFAPEVSGQGVVVIENPVSGETRRITGPEHSARMPVWSPDETLIAFSSEQDGRSAIYIHEVATGVERRVVGLPHFARNPAWSPDGSKLAFLSNAEGSWDIWTITIADGTLRRITNNPGHEYTPKWSPDSKMLTFFTTWNEWTDIWLVDVASGDLLQLTDDDHENYRPAWGPDGRDIVFVSDRTGASEIWSLDLETRALTQITKARQAIDYPFYGPGGKEVHFISWFKVAYLRGLQDTLAGWEWADLPWWQTAPWLEGVEDAALSPDGSAMVFRRRVDSNDHLFLYFFARRESRQITFGRANSFTPVWLADGSGFLFTRSLGDWESSNIFKYTLIGAREDLLARHPGARFPIMCGVDLYFLAPEIAYAGRTSLWRKGPGEDAPAIRLTEEILSPEKMACAPGGDSLYVVSLETGKRQVQQFSALDDSFTPLPVGPWTAERPIEEFEPSDDFNPTLSPDGKKIAFISNRDGPDGIYVKYLETNEVRRLTYTKEAESGLFWSPDSTSIYTTSKLEEFAFQKVRIINVFGSEFIGPV